MKCMVLDKLSGDIVRNSMQGIDMLTEYIKVVEQRLWIRLSINKGEWFLNPDLGARWHYLLDNNASPEQICTEIHEEILKDEEVSTVEYVKADDFDKAHRVLNISFSVVLKNGETLTSSGVVNV